SIYNGALRNEYRARKSDEQASELSVQDSRDVVVFAVATAYLQALASAARVDTAKARLASARELEDQTGNRVKNEVSPEIDSIRAQVERQTAEQGLTDAANQLEKDKLTLARITGLAVDQKFDVTDRLAYRAIQGLSSEAATEKALRSRSDLRSAEASAESARLTLRARKAQRTAAISIKANYGGGGVNIGNFNQVYAI